MTSLILLEPPPGPVWAPFAGVRPVAELRAGAWRIRERWERALGGRVSAILGDHVVGFHEIDTPPVRPEGPITGPAIVAASWFAPADRVRFGPDTRRFVSGGRTVAAVIAVGERVAARDALVGEGPAVEIGGLLLEGSHSLLGALETLLSGDCALEASSGLSDPLPDGTLVIGSPEGVLARGAGIEPGVVFDVRHGCVVVERGTEIRSGTRIEGPCWVGPDVRVVGGFIRNSVIGPRCVVRGEVSASVFVGYANKAHDGFVGHSVVGHWVNLGAGTTTSNLKNTYGPVRLQIANERLDTGRTFLGSLIGDHAKTAIGTMLSTGTVIGAGASVFASGPTPRYVRPFAWGPDGELLNEEGFIRIAGRVMPRRDVELTAERAASLSATYRRVTGARE